MRSTAAFILFFGVGSALGCRRRAMDERAGVVDMARCESAVVARVTAQEELRTLARKLGRDPNDPRPRTMAPSSIVIVWMVELGDAHPDAAPLVYPVFYVDPRSGAVTARDEYDGNARTVDDDPARGRPVVDACAPR